MSLWSVLLRELPGYLLLRSRPRVMLTCEVNWQATSNDAVARLLEATPAHLHLDLAGAHALRAALFASVAHTAVVTARHALVQWRAGQIFDLARKELVFFKSRCQDVCVHQERSVETWACMQDDFVFAWDELEARSDSLDSTSVRHLRGRFRGRPVCPLDYVGRL